MIRRILLSTLILSCVLIGLGWLFRIALLESLGGHFATVYLGVPVSFKVEKMEERVLTLSDVKMGSRTRMEHLKISFSDSGIFPPGIKKIEVMASTLDLDNWIELAEESGSSELRSKDPDNYAAVFSSWGGNLERACSVKFTPDVNIEIARLIFEGNEIPLQLKIEGSEQSYGYDLVSWSTFDRAGKTNRLFFSTKLFCKDVDSSNNGEPSVKMETRLRLDLTGLKIKEIENASVEGNAVILTEIGSESKMSWSGALALSGSLSGDSFSLALPEVSGESTLGAQWNGSIKLENFNVKGSESVTGRVLKTSWEMRGNDLITVTDSKLQKPSLGFEIKAESNLKTRETEFEILRFDMNLKENRNWMESVLSLDDDLRIFSGGLQLRGSGKLTGVAVHNISYDLSLSIRKLKLEFGKNSIGPVMVSSRIAGDRGRFRSANGRINIDGVSGGITLKNLVTEFSLIGVDQLKLLGFQVDWSGSEIKFKEADLELKSRRLKPMKVSIESLPLQRLLEFAYGSSVRASGDLNGEIFLRTQNGRPIAENGKLETEEKGRVRVRPAGSRPPTASDLPVNPKAILDNYLYDFRYDRLSLNLNSNESYQLNMTLRALGRNPGYLNGKPLKLSLNLEMNWLKAMESYVLTMGFSDRLRKYFLRMED